MQPLVSDHVPSAVAGLAPSGRLPRTDELTISIALPHRNAGELERLLHDLTDSGSARYRQFLTPQQFADLFSPPEEDYAQVIAYAEAGGLTVTSRHPNRTLIPLTGTVDAIETFFGVHLRLYPHPDEPRIFYAPDTEPTLTTSVPVLRVNGLDNYHIPRRRLVTTAAPGRRADQPVLSGSVPNGGLISSDFRSAYAPGQGLTLTGAGQIVGIYNGPHGFNDSDIAAYQKAAGISPAVPVNRVLVDGTDYPVDPHSLEVTLDIEMAVAMAPGLSQVLVYQGKDQLTTLNRMATDKIALQLSMSWDPPPQNASADQIYKQFQAQGQTFFCASGDGGAYFPGGVDVNGKPFTGSIFYATDPNITVVGGTDLTLTDTGAWQSEAVWTSGGGGFDAGPGTTYPIPEWQGGIDMSANLGSTTLRNSPDVAMPASNVFLFWSGSATTSGGTSAATPLWAGYCALINERAAGLGLPPAGFLNPRLYALGRDPNASVYFHDITVGNNVTGWNKNPDGARHFFAQPGYDLCTGWGTPTGMALINAIAGFVDHFYTTSAAERDNAVQAYGYRIEGTACNVFASPQPGTVPLHRLVKDTHFYTISDQERDNAISNLGYVSEGEACFVYGAPTGTVPFYRLVNVGHFYTTSLQERDNAVAAYGYHPEDIACHVFDAPRSDTVEFYRLVKGNDHFYTTSAAERDNAVSAYGYQDEGAACNVFASPQPGTVPLHRLVKDTHFYTISDAERDNAINNLGYTSEGEACYVFAAPTGTVPLYRLVKTDHFYTTALSERDNAIAVLGYQSENIACHVFESTADNTMPFFRLVTGYLCRL